MNVNPLVLTAAGLIVVAVGFRLARPAGRSVRAFALGLGRLIGTLARALRRNLRRNPNRNLHRNPEVSPEGFGFDLPERATWRSYVAEIPAWFIVVGALLVSFWTQVFAVNGRHFAFWEALVWGASTDAGTIAFLFLAREGIRRNTPTWGAWIGSVACAFMSVQWNVIPAWESGDFLGVESHLWMPALALGTWYWLLHGRKRHVRRSGTPTEAPAEPEPEPEPPAPLPSRRRRNALPEPSGTAVEGRQVGALAEPDGRPRVTLATAARAYRKLAAKGSVSGAALGRELGVSEVSGRKWLRKVQGPGSETRPFRLKVSPGDGQEAAA